MIHMEPANGCKWFHPALNWRISRSWLMKARPFHFKPENQRWPKLTVKKTSKKLSWNASSPSKPYPVYPSLTPGVLNIDVLRSSGSTSCRSGLSNQRWKREVASSAKPLSCGKYLKASSCPAATQLASTEDEWVLQNMKNCTKLWHVMTWHDILKSRSDDQLMVSFYQSPVARCRQLTWQWDSKCRRVCDASNLSLKRWWPSPPGRGLPPWVYDIGAVVCVCSCLWHFFRLHFGHIPTIITGAAIMFE